MNINNSKDIVVLQCSARSNGDTALVASFLEKKFTIKTIDLCELDIHPFSYENRWSDDDFMPLAEQLAHTASSIIFLTPVYWYTMSAQMKILLDRFSDLLKWHKDTGRLFRGKNMGLISISNDPDLNNCFDTPVKLSADYLGITYHGHLHCWIENGKIPGELENSLIDFMQDFVLDEPV